MQLCLSTDGWTRECLVQEVGPWIPFSFFGVATARERDWPAEELFRAQPVPQQVVLQGTNVSMPCCIAEPFPQADFGGIGSSTIGASTRTCTTRP